MTIHMIRLCVGIETVEHLAQVQARRLAETRKAEGKRKVKLRTFTRNRPRRAEELIEAGSLYWVIKGVIRLRQRILGLEDAVNPEGRPRCAIVLDPKHVLTVPQGKRPFQGWRYYKPEDAPADLDAMSGAGDVLPAEMAAELKELGLI